ncbi:hypothetical protein QA646_02620 [Rhizobium sp. CB3090]|uniref:hypothetical protein n=1 Tax=Rhizobium sp. CB3090 TaxID=3039156 RepID=UPI0024B1EBEB|nr:hypothetical protein [Rhizobium sp. CB3090]WFU09781.1 hypothetical protein QA646_02620 [Rhizobium sp. CB3090]
MAAILSIIMTGFAIIGVFRFFSEREFRKNLISDFLKQPLETFFILCLVACFLIFFWGVFIPAIGTIRVKIFGARYELWAAAGILSLLGFVIMSIYEKFRDPK